MACERCGAEPDADLTRYVAYEGDEEALGFVLCPSCSYGYNVLDQLGYRATLKVVKQFERFDAATYGGGEEVQAFLTGWVADYPEESGFIPLQFRCDGFGNFSGFCDPELDRRMKSTLRLQVTDAAEARASWMEIERDIIDQAPIVPLVNVPTVQLVSDRVGNYQAHPQWSVLVDQLWVR